MRYNGVFLMIGILIIQCKIPTYSKYTSSINTPIGATIENNYIIDSIIKPYSDTLHGAMDQIIGFCPMFIEKYKPSSALTNLMADAIAQTAINEGYPIDLCILNYGGIRSTLDSGDITLGETFELMPFDNQITVLQLSAELLKDCIELIRMKGGEPISSGYYKLRFPLQKQYYLVAVNDYMADGGDGYHFLSKSEKRWDTNIKIRDGLIHYIKQNNPLKLDFKNRTL
jgi:2',3'-cyclic-nucleotide 2'-phosphodiesterase (5'-nucleotidase family)